MRSDHIETYQLGSFWWATTTHATGQWEANGPTEVEALLNLAESLLEGLDARLPVDEIEL